MNRIEILIEDLCSEIDFLQKQLDKERCRAEEYRGMLNNNLQRSHQESQNAVAMMLNALVDEDSIVNKGVKTHIQKQL